MYSLTSLSDCHVNGYHCILCNLLSHVRHHTVTPVFLYSYATLLPCYLHVCGRKEHFFSFYYAAICAVMFTVLATLMVPPISTLQNGYCILSQNMVSTIRYSPLYLGESMLSASYILNFLFVLYLLLSTYCGTVLLVCACWCVHKKTSLYIRFVQQLLYTIRVLPFLFILLLFFGAYTSGVLHTVAWNVPQVYAVCVALLLGYSVVHVLFLRIQHNNTLWFIPLFTVGASCLLIAQCILSQHIWDAFVHTTNNASIEKIHTAFTLLPTALRSLFSISCVLYIFFVTFLVAVVTLIVRRNKDNFGRDYYVFITHFCLRMTFRLNLLIALCFIAQLLLLLLSTNTKGVAFYAILPEELWTILGITAVFLAFTVSLLNTIRRSKKSILQYKVTFCILMLSSLVLTATQWYTVLLLPTT